MHDAHAAPAFGESFVEERHQQLSRFLAAQSVQVELILGHPMAAAELAQDHVRQPIAQEYQFVTGLEANFERNLIGKAVLQDLFVVA